MDVNPYISFFFASLTTMFVIIDPPGNIPMFIAFTEGLDSKLRDRVSKKSTLIAATLLIFVAITGKTVLEFFHISIDGLRIAGGILLFVISVDILLGGSRKKSYIQDSDIDAESLAVFPIALPLYSGPGAITAAIVLYSQAFDLIAKIAVLLSIVVVYIIVRLTHVYSDKLLNILGGSGANIISRLMAIFLAAIAIEYVFEGIEGKILQILKMMT